MNFTFTSVLLRNPAKCRRWGVLEINLFNSHYDLPNGVKAEACAQFLGEGAIQQQNTGIQNGVPSGHIIVAESCPFLGIFPVLGTVFPAS